MEASAEGGWYPVANEECNNCGTCERVCGFVSSPQCTLSDMKHHADCGYWDASFVGYCEDSAIRWNGASGGVTTRLLQILLLKNLVDRVVCVSNTNRPEALFEYVVADSVDDIVKCAKSAYYPVEVSVALEQIISEKKKVAVVGLPCVISSLRNAMACHASLRQNIVFLIGLVCGQQKSRFYTEYLIEQCGLPGTVKSVCYRQKDSQRAASNFQFQVKTETGTAQLGWNESVAEVWTSEMFKLNACYFCSDVFAEHADIALMDAWLPEYSVSPWGYSLILSRKQFVSDLLQKDALLIIKDIPLETLIKSQSEPLQRKREWSEIHWAQKIRRGGYWNKQIVRLERELKLAYMNLSRTTNEQWHLGRRGNDFEQAIAGKRRELSEAFRRHENSLKLQKLCKYPFRTAKNVLVSRMKRIWDR